MAIMSGRTATRLGGALSIVVALALVATMCTSSDDSNPIGTVPIGPGTGEVLALGPPGEPLSVRLSAGTALAGDDPEPTRVVEGEPGHVLDDLAGWHRGQALHAIVVQGDQVQSSRQLLLEHAARLLPFSPETRGSELPE